MDASIYPDNQSVLPARSSGPRHPLDPLAAIAEDMARPNAHHMRSERGHNGEMALIPVRTVAYTLAGILAAAGTTHITRPKIYDGIVPRFLPGEARFYTVASGWAEFGLSAALSLPRTRRFGALFAALFFIAVFPANIKMARDYMRSQRVTRSMKIVALARLPLQIPLVWAALVASRKP